MISSQKASNLLPNLTAGGGSVLWGNWRQFTHTFQKLLEQLFQSKQNNRRFLPTVFINIWLIRNQ